MIARPQGIGSVLRLLSPPSLHLSSLLGMRKCLQLALSPRVSAGNTFFLLSAKLRRMHFLTPPFYSEFTILPASLNLSPGLHLNFFFSCDELRFSRCPLVHFGFLFLLVPLLSVGSKKWLCPAICSFSSCRIGLGE